MKNMLIAAVAALGFAVTAVPATAQSFTGPRVEATVGFSDVTKARDTTGVLYGLNAGIDAPIGATPWRVGVEATTDQLFDRDRDIGVSGRLGYVLGQDQRVMVYGKAGYANFREIDFRNRSRALDGLRVGGGVEFALTDNVYTKAEYRYTDFEGKSGKHGGQVGIGLRF